MRHALRTAILRRFPTQEDAALVLRMHSTRLSKILRGRATPTPDEVRRLIEVLGVSVDVVMAVEPRPATRPGPASRPTAAAADARGIAVRA